MAWTLGSTLVFTVTAAAAAGSPPHSSQHGIPEGRATIRGPAFERPLELAGQPYFDLIYLTGLVPDWSPPPPGQRMSEPSSDEIGSAHEVTYSFRVAGQKPVFLKQMLYFGTEGFGEVLVETKPGQVIPLGGGDRLEVPGGWWRSIVLGDFLGAVAVAKGLPEFSSEPTDPVSAPARTPTAPDADPPPAGEQVTSTSRLLLGIAALSLLLLIGAVESRPGKLKTPS
jgi:hypothetical protein